MSERLLERVRAANPIPPSAVHGLDGRLRGLALVVPPPPCGRRGWSRTRVLVVALAVAALVAAPALAFRFGVIDFSSAPAAPPRVVKDFSSLSVGAPAGMDPHVAAGETRLVGEILGHRLWVAPTKDGGLCFEWTSASGGCDRLGTVPLSVTWSGPATATAVPSGSFAAVDGFAHSRWVDDVQVKLDDGSTIKPPVLWVSPPIGAGFFFYRAPAGRTITAVRAFRRGTVVAADDGGSGAAAPGAHPFADLAKKTKIAAIETDAGAATLWTAPTLTDGRCTWLQYRQQELPVVPCLPQGYEHQSALAFAVHSLGGHTILAGECGYSAVEFIHDDSTTRTVACTDGLILTDLQPADANGALRAIDAQGRPLPGTATQVPPTAAQP